MKIKVAIANYGKTQLPYLYRMIDSFLGFKEHEVDITVHSDIEIDTVYADCVIEKLDDWHMLPFACRKSLKYAYENQDYDLFIYSENDILYLEKNINAFLEASKELESFDMIPGFILAEYDKEGHKYYPNFHKPFEFKPAVKAGSYIVSHFTNLHHAGFMFTRKQLDKIVNNVDFLSTEFGKQYSLNTPKIHASTNLYSFGGFTKVIPLSHLDDFVLHHMPNKYVKDSRLGKPYFIAKDYINASLYGVKRLHRLKIIQAFIHKLNAKSYLEIGCDKDQVFKKINVPIKVGVDPIRGGNIRMTSNLFFRNSIQKFDVIFIDGMHRYAQVYRDINNALSRLNDGGVIICHDMKPETELMQRVPRASKIWTGDCWKAWLDLRQQRSDLTMFVVDCDYGVGVIRKGRQKLLKQRAKDYDSFSYDIANQLNLVTQRFFYEYINSLPDALVSGEEVR